MKSHMLALLAPALLLTVSTAGEDRPVASSIHASPEAVELSGPYASVQLILTGTNAQGSQVDWTRSAELVSEPRLVEIDDRRHVRPVGEGEEVLRFQQGDVEIEVPVKVTGLDQSPRVSFIRDVAPALSRLGCNAGTCHGSANGQNGFQLSATLFRLKLVVMALSQSQAAR